MQQEVRLRKRQKYGKYKIEGCLLQGPYANVYSACDTIEGVMVALKIPHKNTHDKDYLDDFKRETRIVASLDHPNILPLKNASFVGDTFTMVSPLGSETLESRLKRRLSTDKAFEYALQLLAALAYAHEHGVMHCDVKPANLILFGPNRLRLADFGIAKTTFKTVQASGSGTLGYLAPEQAMGRPSFRSDVFAAGLILHQMLCGQMHEWPFRWPSVGIKRLRQRIHPGMVEFIRRSLEFEPNKRFRDAVVMHKAFLKLQRKGQLAGKFRGGHSRASTKRVFTGGKHRKHWREVQFKQFQHHYGKELQTHLRCNQCQGPMSENMAVCPWCQKKPERDAEQTRYAAICPHCERGVKKDWLYCPWCFGSGFEKESNRRFADKRYTDRCSRASCDGPLMPFMRYCPWCHAKTKQRWTVKGLSLCKKCNWGVAKEDWSYCPWCTTSLESKR